MINARILFIGIIILITCSVSQLFSKIEIVQRRFVPQENIPEFLERETQYWSEVARKAIDEGKMDSWSIWRRVDGMSLDSEYNFMFVSTFLNETDLKHAGEMWKPEMVIQGLNPTENDTTALSTVKAVLFYEQMGFSQKKDPKYIRINYAKAESVQDYVDVELEEWSVWIQGKQTSSVGSFPGSSLQRGKTFLSKPKVLMALIPYPTRYSLIMVRMFYSPTWTDYFRCTIKRECMYTSWSRL